MEPVALTEFKIVENWLVKIASWLMVFVLPSLSRSTIPVTSTTPFLRGHWLVLTSLATTDDFKMSTVS